MTLVNTVLGAVDSSELGFTLSHEHVLVASAGIPQVYPEFIDREATIAAAVSGLAEAYEAGVRTIVDVTTMDLGRDVRLLEEVSRRSRVQIIACTGTWLDIPRVFRSVSPDVVAGLYVREIEVGIERTAIRAGVIKVATDGEGVTPANEVILRAAARAHKRTGVPITTHTSAQAKVGNAQIAIFEEEGVDLTRVCIGHSNDTDDIEYLVGVARKGAYVGLDHYPGGRTGGLDWEQRTEILKRLIDAGVGDKLMLSHDYATTVTIANRDQLERRHPNGYAFVAKQVLPRLRELGVPEVAIQRLVSDNPRQYFEPTQ